MSVRASGKSCPVWPGPLSLPLGFPLIRHALFWPMLLTPANVIELSKSLAEASALGTRISGFDLSAIAGLIEYMPADMTITVQTGMRLADLQSEAAKNRQWLPIDPPHPERVTVDQLLNRNLSGPRRFGCGTIREHLIGMKAVLSDGRVIHNGGRVVKNVAGFDLCKLFVGSHWTLGVMVEATFKLRPLAAREVFVETHLDNVTDASVAIQRLLDLGVTPVALDLYSAQLPKCTLVAAFAGEAEEVDWQLEQLKTAGTYGAASLSHEELFWNDSRPVYRASFLPSTLPDQIAQIHPHSFVARAGNGAIYYRGDSPPPKNAAPDALSRRLKETFDARNVLPDFPTT